MSGGFGRLLSRLAALAMLAGVCAAVYALVVSPALEHDRELGARISEQRFLLGRLQAAGPQDRPAEGQFPPGSLYLAGESDSIRIAGLQSIIGRIAEASGVRLASFTIAEPRQAPGVRLIGIDAQLEARLEQLQEILHAIETEEPALFVDELGIVAGTGEAGSSEGKLTVRLVVLGAAPPAGG